MNSNLPEYSHKIERKALSESDYFITLMNTAIRLDLISAEEELSIKAQCGELLAFRTNQYTEGQSSSVTADTARELLSSVYYLIGLGLKKYQEPDDALEYLLREGANAVYTEGALRQRELLLKAKKIYQTLNASFNSYGCIYYGGTVRKGLSGFFKKYIPDNHKLFANDTIITADYPTYLNTKALSGIEFVKNYIEQIYCENAFCTLFAESAVTSLLRSYDSHFERVIFNVFELVYTRALGRIICGEEPLCLEKPENYHEKLEKAFDSKSRTVILGILTDSLKTLFDFVTPTGACAKYAEFCLNQTASAITTAMRLGAIKRIFY